MEQSNCNDEQNTSHEILACCRIQWRIELFDNINELKSKKNNPDSPDYDFLSEEIKMNGYGPIWSMKPHSSIDFDEILTNDTIREVNIKYNKEYNTYGMYHSCDYLMNEKYKSHSRIGYAIVHPMWVTEEGKGYFTFDQPGKNGLDNGGYDIKKENAKMLYSQRDSYYEKIRILVKLEKKPLEKDWEKATVRGIFHIDDWEETILETYVLDPRDTSNQKNWKKLNIEKETLDVYSFRIDKNLMKILKEQYIGTEPREIIENFLLNIAQEHQSIKRCFNIFQVCHDIQERQEYYAQLDKVLK